MEFIIIIAIIFAVINANNKKKQAEQQKQAQQRQADVRSLEADETRAAERLRDYQAERQKRQERGVQAAAAPMERTAPQGAPARPGEGQGSAWRNNQPRRGEVLHVLRKAALWRKHELCFFGRHGRIHRGQSGPRLPWRSRAGDGPRACSPRLRSTACCEAAYGIDAPACGIQHNGH